MATRTENLLIQGMSCATCARTISTSLEGIDGVSGATVNFAADEATVTYDPELVSLEEIYAGVEAAGYHAVRETVTIGITDMSCATCAKTNKQALADTPGVIEADVNFAADEARVEYNPEETSLEDLYIAIESAGYTPVREMHDEAGRSERERREDARNAEVRRQLRLTLFGTVLTTPLVVFLALRLLVSPTVVPEAVFGIGIGWIELALATPVQVVLGWQFYTNSYVCLPRSGGGRC